jgi:hypothetical protein
MVLESDRERLPRLRDDEGVSDEDSDGLGGDFESVAVRVTEIDHEGVFEG